MRATERLQPVAWWTLTLAVAAYTLLVIHDFYRYVDHAIYIATDDALANISYTLAAIGRYGFLTSPVLVDVPRNHSQFNYGPWYFGVGAGLIWLFGYSLTLLRSIHLWVMVAVAGAATRWFRDGRYSPAWAIASIGVLWCFATTQWPMVRPDSMVSLFAVLMVMAAGSAIHRVSLPMWAAAGLFAACGAFTHLIAWSLVPAVLVIWAVHEGVAAHWRPSGLSVRPLLMRLASVSGGLAGGALMFYGSFGFRIRTQLAFLMTYRAFTAANLSTNGEPTGFLSLFTTHLHAAFGDLPPLGQAALFIAFVVGWIAVACCARWSAPVRGTVLTWCLPPLAVWTCYSLSLGTYANFHAGYKVLTQVMAFWFCAGLLSAIFTTLWTHRPALATPAALATAVACGMWVAVITRHALTQSDYRELRTREWVGITPYIDEILRPLPAGATAWGTVMYGIENPDRIQLVQFTDAMHLMSDTAPAERMRLAPEYLVWGFPENVASAQAVLRKSPNDLETFSRMFAPLDYRLVSVSAGAPYGVTRVYERHAGLSEPDSMPLVSVYDPKARQWIRQMQREAAVPGSSDPIALTARARDRVLRGRTTSTRLVTLPAGDYAIRARLSLGSKSNGGIVVAAPGLSLTLETDMGVTPDVASYGTGNTDALVISHHDGGDLHVGLIDSDAGSTLTDIEAYRMRPLGSPESTAAVFKGVAPWTSWETIAINGIHSSLAANGLAVDGDDSRFGYQLMSPDIPVAANAQVQLRVGLSVAQGRVCVGALNRTQQRWLVTPDELRLHAFRADSTGGIRVVVTNCGPAEGPTTRSRFVVSSAEYAVAEPRIYADDMVDVAQRSKATRR
jgi:hypothetical protein